MRTTGGEQESSGRGRSGAGHGLASEKQRSEENGGVQSHPAPTRLLITGAGGFCGGHAVNRFSEAGYEVYAMFRPGRSPAAASLDAGQVRVMSGSLEDPDSMRQLVESISPDAILHLAGSNHVGASWQDPAACLQSNLMGTVHLLEAVRSAGRPCRVVVAGSMIGYTLPETGLPRPPHPYGLSKALQVAASLSWHAMYGMDVIVADPGNLIGPGPSTGLCSLLARHAAACEAAAAAGEAAPPVFQLSSATEQRDFLDVRDAIAAYEAILQRGESGRRYVIASGQMTSLGELAKLYGRLAACEIEFEIGDSASPSPEAADISALLELGWRPSISLEQSAAATLDYARRT